MQKQETMTMKIPETVALISTLALMALTAPPSSAQVSPSPATPERPLELQKMQSGFVLAPDFRISEVDDDLASLAGAYAGWLTDDTLFIGAGGYWQTNGSRDRQLSYGGVIVEWSRGRSGRVGLSLRGLVGGGGGRLGVEVEGLVFPRRPRFGRGARDVEPEAVTRTLLAREDFFVAEPQATLTLQMTRWLRLGVGGSYRFIAGAGELNSRFGGLSASVSLQLGSF